jgi:hypothetical protein
MEFSPLMKRFPLFVLRFPQLDQARPNGRSARSVVAVEKGSPLDLPLSAGTVADRRGQTPTEHCAGSGSRERTP